MTPGQCLNSRPLLSDLLVLQLELLKGGSSEFIVYIYLPHQPSECVLSSTVAYGPSPTVKAAIVILYK